MISRRITLDQGQILDLLPPCEGALKQYYGRIRNGKTYAATCDILYDLKIGQIVYANWPIIFNGFDERKSFFKKILGLVGFKKRFWNFPKENFNFVDTSNMGNVLVNGISTGKNFYDWIKTLTSCSIYLDEGHIFYDSYMALKMEISDRIAILDTGHYDRTINIISQRPTAIHAVLRGNVNQFFKCEKIIDFHFFNLFHLVRFQKTEFQDTDANEKPNEERVKILDKETGILKDSAVYQYAIKVRLYWGRKKIYKIYNTKYRRGNLKESQYNNGQLFLIKWLDWFRFGKKN